MSAIIFPAKRRAAGAAGPVVNGPGSPLRGSRPAPRGSRSSPCRYLTSGLAVVVASALPAAGLSTQPAVAAARPSWTVQPSPNVRAPDSLLSAVSCSAASACTAVAETARRPGRAPVALRWNGRTWTTQVTAAVRHGGLSAVSCPSRSACVAVGMQRNPLPATLAEAWDGTSWTVMPAPKLSGTLSAVSCPSGTACMATGSGGPSGAALAASWNGRTWTAVPTPPVGGENSTLDSVSCTSASACTAVGDVVFEVGDDGGQKVVPLAERWNGTGWVVQAPPS